MTTRPARRGFTLLEVLLVMAVLILLAAVILPSLGAFRGDSRPQAAADSIRSELAVSRARAMTENRPYRIAVNDTGERLRRGPDGPDFAEAVATDHADGNSATVEYAFERVTAEILSTPSAVAGASGWQTVAVVLPAGTCFDDMMTIGLKDPDNPQSVLRLQIRGLTAGTRVLPRTAEDRK
ncbi:MAG: Tfp pilus assembly protein FimT/FimU [Gemmata sp.]